MRLGGKMIKRLKELLGKCTQGEWKYFPYEGVVYSADRDWETTKKIMK